MDNTVQKESPLAFTTANESAEFLGQTLAKKQQALAAMALDVNPLERAVVQYDIAEIMLELKRGGMPEAAWGLAKEAFSIYVEHKQWEAAVRCADLLYQTEQKNALIALANGLWLAVTYPIDAELTLIMLNHVIDDTPDNSDGAAVAAIVAHYIADMRLTGEKRDSVMFLTSNMISKVAERHSNVDNQQKMDMWLARLDLKNPEIFLPRLGMVVDALANGDWWYDRDALRAELPVN